MYKKAIVFSISVTVVLFVVANFVLPFNNNQHELPAVTPLFDASSILPETPEADYDTAVADNIKPSIPEIESDLAPQQEERQTPNITSRTTNISLFDTQPFLIGNRLWFEVSGNIINNRIKLNPRYVIAEPKGRN